MSAWILRTEFRMLVGLIDNCRRLFRFTWPERHALLLIFPLTFISAVCTALQPWPIKILFDHVLADAPLPLALDGFLGIFSSGNSRTILAPAVAIGAILLFLVQSAVGAAIAWIWVTAGRRTTFRLAQDLFARLQGRSLLFHRQTEVGELMTRVLKDSRCVSEMVDKLFVTPVIALFSILAMIFIMAHYDRMLAVLALALSPAIIAGSLAAGRPLEMAAQLKRSIEGRLQSLVQQTLAGLPVVQAFSQEESIQRRYRELAEAQIRTAKRTAVLTSFNNLSSGILSTIARGVIIWVGAKHILEGQLSVGSGALFIVYFEVMLARTKALADLYPNFRSLKVNAGHILKVLRAQPEVAERPGARGRIIRGNVQFDNVTAGYEPGSPVLKNISFEVKQGQTVAVLSASGGGKTTLVNLIPRLADPWVGQVKIDSVDVRDQPLRSLREQVSIVFQEPFLSSLTVAENIAGARTFATRKEIEAAARAAMAHDFIMALPDGYDTRIGERGGILSGGMRQRLSIARALLKNAPILILDEPTSALDAQTERDLLDALQPLMKNKSTFVVAHRLSTIVNADRIIILDQGRLVESGTHSELLRQGGYYTRLMQIVGNSHHSAT